jgi:hypothetical protein
MLTIEKKDAQENDKIILGVISTIEAYPSIKKNEIMSFAEKWMKLVVLCLRAICLT